MNGTNKTSYIYDNRDNLLSLKDAKNQITRFTYDRNNRLTKETRPLGQELNYVYDELGDLKQKIDSKNQKTEYIYDNTGKLQNVKYFNPADPVNPVKNILFSFDNVGNLKSYNDGITQSQYQYDALYRKINETINYGPFSKSFQYDYYKNSLKKTYTDPAGIVYTYSYDPNNQLASIQIPDQGNITYQSYKWLAPTSILFPGGSKREFEYDPLMRIKKITSFDPGQNVLLNYQYSYDKMDNIKTKTTEHGNYAYNYDDLYRLTDDKRPVTGEGYKYDEVGNRVTSVSGVTVNWAYNQNNELQNYDGVSFQYDANGNMIQKITDNGQLVTVDYEYDIENRLIQVKDGNGNVIAKYEYDPFGRRLWKEVDGTKQYFIYCDEGLAAELDQNGSLTKAYGWKPNSTWTTDPVFMREGESYYYYHNDHLGTPQKLTAQNGLVVWSAKYTAFGEAAIDPVSTITNNLRFPGQYADEETQLNYNYHRYYDPRSGRYITADPIGINGGVNLFAYVGNDPVNGVDPFGLKVKRIVINSIDNIACIIEDNGTRRKVPVASGNDSYRSGTYYVRDWIKDPTFNGFSNTQTPWSIDNGNPYGPYYAKITDSQNRNPRHTHMHGTNGPMVGGDLYLGGPIASDRNLSHGCIRFPNTEIEYLQRNAPRGTPIIFSTTEKCDCERP